MLSNLETEKSKLLQIVLVGQPNLRDKLAVAGARAAAAADHGQLSPAAARCGRDGRYINHRLRRAALGAPLEFPADVTDLDPRAQPRRAAHHQRDLRRGARLRVRGGAARVRSCRLSGRCSAELETTGVLPPRAGRLRRPSRDPSTAESSPARRRRRPQPRRRGTVGGPQARAQRRAGSTRRVTRRSQREQALAAARARSSPSSGACWPRSSACCATQRHGRDAGAGGRVPVRPPGCAVAMRRPRRRSAASDSSTARRAARLQAVRFWGRRAGGRNGLCSRYDLSASGD